VRDRLEIGLKALGIECQGRWIVVSRPSMPNPQSIS
jgi:hypothetical protein